MNKFPQKNIDLFRFHLFSFFLC